VAPVEPTAELGPSVEHPPAAGVGGFEAQDDGLGVVQDIEGSRCRLRLASRDQGAEDLALDTVVESEVVVAAEEAAEGGDLFPMTAASSPGRTSVFAVMPCFKALNRDRSLPSGVLGPVLFRALRRLISARSIVFDVVLMVAYPLALIGGPSTTLRSGPRPDRCVERAVHPRRSTRCRRQLHKTWRIRVVSCRDRRSTLREPLLNRQLQWMAGRCRCRGFVGPERLVATRSVTTAVLSSQLFAKRTGRHRGEGRQCRNQDQVAKNGIERDGGSQDSIGQPVLSRIATTRNARRVM
jgi:hypothetical protein